jgi:HEAT repeat protein
MRTVTCLGIILLLGGPATIRADRFGPKKEDVPKYLLMLKSAPDARDRALGAEMLGKRGEIQARDVKDAIDPLIEAMKKDKSADVRKAAAAALGNIGTQSDKVVPALMGALKDKSPQVNLAAVNALGQYGMDARPAVPALREFAKSKKDKKIAQMVRQAIKRINARVQ